MLSKDSMPYGVAASAKAAIDKAVMVRTFCWSSVSPSAMISTRLFRCGRIAQPMRIAICWIILIPVCRACQDFLLRQTAFKNGSSDGIPRAEATTAKARAVVLRTYSSAHQNEFPSNYITDRQTRIVNVRTHDRNHRCQASSLGQVGNDFATLDASVVVLVDQKRLNNDENLVDKRPYKIVELVQNAVDHLQ